jgi:hypothetical protein
MSNVKMSAETKADIQHVREELMLTVREVATALSKRRGGVPVLLEVAGDLEQEAKRFRKIAS